MEQLGATPLETVVLLVVVVGGGAALFALAVWFGLYIVAPRVRRALDRADADEEEPGDRPD